MGLMYTLSITAFSKNMLEKEETYNLKKLLLEKVGKKNGYIELFIFDDTAVLRHNKKVVDANFKLPKGSEFYTFLQNEKQKEEFGYFLEEEYLKEIEFKFEIFPNGSSTKAILKVGDKYQTYFPYFEDIKGFDDLYEAKEYLLKEKLRDNLEVYRD